MAHMKAVGGLVFLTSFPVAFCHPLVFTVNFCKYPGYDGVLGINGSVAIMETSTEGVQQLSWDLSGLDTSCTAGAGDNITNGCGIHVHAGTSCENASEVGGHFHNSQQDPWLDIVYVSDSDGRSVGTAMVTTGFDVSDFSGRAFVVHEKAGGKRAACGILGAAASVSSAGFSPYPGYAGNLAVSGSVTLAAASDSTQLLTWELFGLDVACDSIHAAANVTNGCGIHVHLGTSCEEAGDVEGHMFSTSSDPWLDVVYVADSSGTSRGVAMVDAGVSLSDIVGRAFVVHELSLGGRVSCATLGESGLLRTGPFGPYPGYSGALDVNGTVILSASGTPGRHLVAWDLHGLDEACLDGAADGVTNGCGVHVHSGTSCAEADLVGGHLFAGQIDPWLDVVYVSDGSGSASGSAQVETGLDLAALAGRAIVVHRLDSGARVACGTLFAAASTSAEVFSPYPGYAGDLRTTGSATLSVAGPTSQLLSWDLTGLDTSCSTPGAADGIPNGCGIHVHAGMTCADKDGVGGHFFSGNLTTDPWAEVRYVADANGSSSGAIVVDTGLPLIDMVGKAFVVHRLQDGGRVACGTLEMALDQAPSPAPTAAPTAGSGGSGGSPRPTAAPTGSPNGGNWDGLSDDSGSQGLAVEAVAMGIVAYMIAL